MNQFLEQEAEDERRAPFYEMAHAQRECKMCGRLGNYESHHVVEKAEIRRQCRLDLLWDPRNCMRLCSRCHDDHTDRGTPVPLRVLLDMHFEFAFELLGLGAGRYLLEKYGGDDRRLDEFERKYEEEHAPA